MIFLGATGFSYAFRALGGDAPILLKVDFSDHLDGSNTGLMTWFSMGGRPPAGQSRARSPMARRRAALSS